MTDDPLTHGPIDNRIDALINIMETKVLYLISLSPKVWHEKSDVFRQNQIYETKQILFTLECIRNELINSNDENKGAGR